MYNAVDETCVQIRGGRQHVVYESFRWRLLFRYAPRRHTLSRHAVGARNPHPRVRRPTAYGVNERMQRLHCSLLQVRYTAMSKYVE
jgi:hypothetical protein